MSQQIDGPARYQKPEESGMPHAQPTAQAMTALLRNAASVDAQKTKSLCCVAAGITALASSTTEARTPHEKLRGAATPGATLNAQSGPLAQLVEGYKYRPNSKLLNNQKSIFLAEILKKTMCFREHMRNRSAIPLNTNHQSFRILNKRLSCSGDTCHGRHKRLEQRHVSPHASVCVLIISEVLEGVCYFSAHTKLGTLCFQANLKSRFPLGLRGRRCRQQPDIPLLRRPGMPYPLAKMKSRDRSIDGVIAQSLHRIDALRKLSLLKLLDLPIKLCQHIAYSFDLERSNGLRRSGTTIGASSRHKDFFPFQLHTTPSLPVKSGRQVLQRASLRGYRYE
ncbi:hypothetical protein [Pseudomonas protegens]|uniref:hypothetical protein n=1 Tax=Pseudomonas protegens TaxID=380021 RepID=UPI001A918976|nr:hypothetical protein [Pseudomonas protegens]